MFERIWDFIVDSMVTCFMPLVCSYYAITANIFINVSAKDAQGLEWMGNNFLAPAQYLLAGKEAILKPDGSWEFVQRFDYNNGFWYKTTSSIISFVPSIIIGSAIKALGLLNQESRSRHQSMFAAQSSSEVHSLIAVYKEMGIELNDTYEPFLSQGCQRRPGDENVLKDQRDALQEIAAVLNEAKITWWVDCGTCLGAYRYGGAIPWDGDVDIGVLIPDFQNVLHALNKLDKKKYIVQDWSSRDFPDSYIKVFIRKSGTLIDIYHFAIDREKKEIFYILSLENHMFFPEWWKIRERRFKPPVAFDVVFPLKKGIFDGVEVFVPNDIVAYLQRYYGENLDPAKVYNPITNAYEKDLNHPYWQRAYAH